MTFAQVKRIFEGAGYSTTGVIQTPLIKTLVFTTNQGIDYHRDFLSFDETLNLLKIKQYNYKPINGIFADFVIDGNNLSSSSNIARLNKFYPFRSPRVGDIVFLVDSAGTIASKTYTITWREFNSIQLDKEITNYSSDKTICYADPEFYTSAVADPLDKYLFFYYSPYTSRTADVYIDLTYFMGIEATSNHLGNS